MSWGEAVDNLRRASTGVQAAFSLVSSASWNAQPSSSHSSRSVRHNSFLYRLYLITLYQQQPQQPQRAA